MKNKRGLILLFKILIAWLPSQSLSNKTSTQRSVPSSFVPFVPQRFPPGFSSGFSLPPLRKTPTDMVVSITPREPGFYQPLDNHHLSLGISKASCGATGSLSQLFSLNKAFGGEHEATRQLLMSDSDAPLWAGLPGSRVLPRPSRSAPCFTWVVCAYPCAGCGAYAL